MDANSSTRKILKGTPSAASHFIKVSIFRFADYRRLALLGKTEEHTQSVLDGILGVAESDTSSGKGLEAFDPALPLFGKAGSDNIARTSARGQSVNSNPLRVYSIGPIDEVNEPGSGGPRSEVIGSVIRVQTSKNMGTAAGSFSITAGVFAEWIGLLHSAGPDVGSGPDNSIHKYVEAGDWVEINVVRCSNESDLDRVYERCLMVGKVDSVSLSISPPGAGGCRVTIEGRDVGSVWADTPLYFNVYDPARNNAIGEVLIKALNDVSGRPDQVVMQMLGLVDNPVTTYGVPPVVPDYGLWTTTQRSVLEWRECWSTRFVSKETRGIISDPNMLTPNSYTPLWSFVETYGVPQLNEIYVDTLPEELGPLNRFDPNDPTSQRLNPNGSTQAERYAYLFMQEKPFPCIQHGEDSPWFKRAVTTVFVGEIQNSQLKRGTERYNHINVLIEMPSTLNDDVFALAPPIADYHSILRHGLKKLDVTLPLISTGFEGSDADSESGVQAIGNYVKSFRDLILCWNILNPYYWNGTINLVGIRGDIRVGDILLVVGPSAVFADGPFTDPGPDFWTARKNSPESVAKKKADNRGNATTFYVEAVSYLWGSGVAPQSQTSISVSRGYVDNLRLPHIKALYPLWKDATDPNSVPESTRPARMAALLKEVGLMNEANTNDGAVPPQTGGTGGIGPDDEGVGRNTGLKYPDKGGT